jgi:hypothetical protein
MTISRAEKFGFYLFNLAMLPLGGRWAPETVKQSPEQHALTSEFEKKVKSVLPKGYRLSDDYSAYMIHKGVLGSPSIAIHGMHAFNGYTDSSTKKATIYYKHAEEYGIVEKVADAIRPIFTKVERIHKP